MFHGGPGFARVAAVAVAGASCLAVAACGGLRASSLSIVPSASSTPDPLAHLTASKVATEAMANLKAASSVTMAGTVTYSGKNFALNLGLKTGHGCAGTFREGRVGSVKFIMIGTTIYFHADDQFWKSQGGSHASAIIALINGRYIKTSTRARGMSSMVGLCDLPKRMAPGKVTGTFTKGKLTTLGSTRVLPIANPKEGVLYVTDTSKPEIAEVVAAKKTGNGSGKFTVSVGAPVTLTAPPASQVIDGSAFGM
jgi:hypothetical protein